MVGGNGFSGEAAEFWESFGRLSAEQQELVLLVFHYGFSQKETAGILGIPVGTVKSRTYYARRRLQELLEGGSGGG
jgi:RNA polymerase sigma-70 factor (ECF subfamily)